MTESVSKTRKNGSKSATIDHNMIYGKMPPQAVELETAILGAIMLERNAFDVANEIIKAECFYKEVHQLIYKAIEILAKKSASIDILTVCNTLRENGNLEAVGGPYYVTKLTNSVVSSVGLETHCRILLQKYIQREMIRISGETLNAAYDDTVDVFSLIDQHERSLTEITTGHLQKTFTQIDTEVVKRIQRIEELRHKQDHITGVPTGYPDLDSITHGWQPTDLIILAARPSVGKTAFALNLARNAILNPGKSVPVALFSMEMSTGQLVDRLLSAETEIGIEKITNGFISESEMQVLYSAPVSNLSGSKLFIDDTAALDVFRIRSRCRMLKRKFGIGLIIIDYLQLMSGATEKRGNREQEISDISRNLKGLAKELSVPIIALSQLSRETEKRTGSAKMPILSDLRESGAIEQDADVVMFMYRPEYYDVQASNMGDSVAGETHLKIAKHRNGRLDTVKLKAKLSIQKFFAWDGGDVPASLPKGNWRPVSLPFADGKDQEIEF